MELRQLEYFMAVCEKLHFSRAAEKIRITQPTLSQQIKMLENELSIPLFNRIGKRITMTEAGKILYKQSERIFSHVKHAQDAIAELKQVEGGSLTIGVLPGDADLLFTALLLDFHKKHPKISLSLVETTQVAEQVTQGILDIGVTTASPPDDRVIQIPLFHEEFSLAVAKDHSLAKKTSLQLKDLQEIKTVLFPPDHQCRKLIDQFCMKEGFRLQPQIETTTIASLINMVQQGIGVSVLPRLLLESLPDDQITIVSLVNPTPSQDICLMYRADKYLGFATRTFMQTIEEYIQAVIHRAQSS